MFVIIKILIGYMFTFDVMIASDTVLNTFRRQNKKLHAWITWMIVYSAVGDDSSNPCYSTTAVCDNMVYCHELWDDGVQYNTTNIKRAPLSTHCEQYVKRTWTDINTWRPRHYGRHLTIQSAVEIHFRIKLIEFWFIFHCYLFPMDPLVMSRHWLW